MKRPTLEAGFLIRERMKPSLRKWTLTGALIALSVSLGYAFIAVPNVEMITAGIFISGYALGIKEGFAVGLAAEAIYSGLNPYGMAAPPIFLAQVLSMAVIGMAGGIMGARPPKRKLAFILTLALAGFLGTLLFDVTTTLFYALFIELSRETLIGSFLYGLGFYATHLLSNSLIFLTIVPVVIGTLERLGWLPTLGRLENA